MILTQAQIISLVLFTVCSIIYITKYKYQNRKLILKRMHNAIKLAYDNHSEPISYDEILRQLFNDFNSTISTIGSSPFTSCTELLEHICCRYNTYSDRDFKASFDEPRNLKVRAFVCELCNKMKERNWYIELPDREANLVRDIQEALHTGHSNLGIAALRELVLDIHIHTQKQTNRKMPFEELLNKVCILLTFVSTVLSFIHDFPLK